MRGGRQRIPELLCVLVCVALVGAGCTARQSRDQYDERLAQALAARTHATAALEGNTLRTPQQYDVEARAVDSALDELDADPPPRDATAAHERMVSGLEGLSALLDRLGRCRSLEAASAQDARACRQSIDQDVYDQIRNDFGEANTIYREEGFSQPELGSDDDATGGGDSLGEDPEGGDEL